MSAGPPAAVCSAPGCQKRTWDGEPGYCSTGCRGDQQPAGAPTHDDAAAEPWEWQGDEQDYSQSQAAAAGGYPSWGGAFQDFENGFPYQALDAAPWPPTPPPPPRMASPEMCQLDGCTQPTYDGKPGYCSRAHRNLVVPPCQFPGCKRSAYQGKPGFCGIPHRDQARAMGLPCAAAGLRRSASLQVFPAAAAAAGPPPLLAALAARQGAPTCGNFRTAASSVLVQPGDPERQGVWQQFCGNWPAHVGTCPAEAGVAFYKITMPQQVVQAFQARVQVIGNQTLHGHGQNPGNRQRRFHGTNFLCSFQGQLCGRAANGDCPGCGILMHGFRKDFRGRNSGNMGHFGKGHYSTAKGGTAYSYSKKGTKPAVLVCCVAVGKADMLQAQSGSQNLADIQPGCHSKVIDKSSGVDELLVPDDDQILPLWVMVFS